MKATAHPQDFQDIALTRQGDDVAFTRLVERYQAPVYNLCYRMLSDPDLAEDAPRKISLRPYRDYSTALLKKCLVARKASDTSIKSVSEEK